MAKYLPPKTPCVTLEVFPEISILINKSLGIESLWIGEEVRIPPDRPDVSDDSGASWYTIVLLAKILC